MAYVSQSLKKQLAPAIKAVLKKYKMKGSIAVNKSFDFGSQSEVWCYRLPERLQW